MSEVKINYDFKASNEFKAVCAGYLLRNNISVSAQSGYIYFLEKCFDLYHEHHDLFNKLYLTSPTEYVLLTCIEAKSSQEVDTKFGRVSSGYNSLMAFVTFAQKEAIHPFDGQSTLDRVLWLNS